MSLGAFKESKKTEAEERKRGKKRKERHRKREREREMAYFLWKRLSRQCWAGLLVAVPVTLATHTTIAHIIHNTCYQFDQLESVTFNLCACVWHKPWQVLPLNPVHTSKYFAEATKRVCSAKMSHPEENERVREWGITLSVWAKLGCPSLPSRSFWRPNSSESTSLPNWHLD